MTEHTQIRLMEWWYKRLISFTKILDSLNKTDHPVFAVVNEGIRRTCKEAIEYINEVTPTEEMSAVTDGMVALYDANREQVRVVTADEYRQMQNTVGG